MQPALAFYGLAAAALMLLGGTRPVHGQWLTQTNRLKPGWNAVFLHVDAGHDTVENVLDADPLHPIEEIWHWHPNLPTGQFVDSPQLPVDTGSQWVTWSRALGPASTLRHLAGNGAYLVRVSGNAPYEWKVKGKPVLPTYRWTLTGLNFIGLPTPAGIGPSFDSFLATAPELQANAEIFRYQGGDLGQTNPVRVFAFRTTPVARDQAYWIRSGDTYNDYFGPIRILSSSTSGLRFGNAAGQARFRLRNAANVPVTVTVQQVASESAPAGQPTVAGAPWVLLRGPINTTDLTYGYVDLTSGGHSWDLAPAGQPGSEVEVTAGLFRYAMAGNPGDVFAGVLRFTDSLGLAQVDMAVSAELDSPAGLWVGTASAQHVSHYLKSFAQATNETDFAAVLQRLQLEDGVDGYHYEWEPTTGRILVFGGPEQKTGGYLLEGPVRVEAGEVARPYPMRLILHNDGSATRLLQTVHHGIGLGSNIVLSTAESLLHPEHLASARRVSSVHWPVTAGNTPWTGAGMMGLGGSLTVTVPVSYDDQASNPFLHTYHPDHDNLDPLFGTLLPRGGESYRITRQVTLNFEVPEDNFDSFTAGSGDFSGQYSEVITIEGRASQSRSFNVLGSFALKRISDIAQLDTP